MGVVFQEKVTCFLSLIEDDELWLQVTSSGVGEGVASHPESLIPINLTLPGRVRVLGGVSEGIRVGVSA